MYFVDRKLLEERLQYMERLIGVFSQETSFEDEVQKLMLERVAHMTIEVMIDVGNQMIDGFIMRDPGSYDDVVDILVDEKVVSKEDGSSLKKLIPWRKALLQEYTEIDHNALKRALQNESATLLSFPGKVRMYLESELGPVSAFLPQKD
ncbi:DUF86 domain-containing protein [Bacillus shivajii]|uniref:DUF86 domain-containing protein n=1 Tax=Bacillus shivajii TaxID=1983719 RepID=UPI001CFAD33C|nr:DUF86 domain-containing protein [Bacillus shivajii]UCZ52546.1 DUF86 domain-containing protein [Bacillus shivajii]